MDNKTNNINDKENIINDSLEDKNVDSFEENNNVNNLKDNDSQILDNEKDNNVEFNDNKKFYFIDSLKYGLKETFVNKSSWLFTIPVTNIFIILFYISLLFFTVYIVSDIAYQSGQGLRLSLIHI